NGQSVATHNTSCSNLSLPLNTDVESESKQTGEHPISHKEIFTFSSRPRSAPHGKSPNMSPEGCMSLDLNEDRDGVCRGAQMEDDFYGSDSNEEEYDWRNYQPSRLSASELQMLASMKRQQNEELEDNGISHGLSASQIDNCNVSISTSSDDTTTWNSCLPPPVNQGHHYQKEMNPLSHSNPRDWLNVFSPPIILPSQELAKHIESSANLNIPGEDDFSAEEDEEVLTLLYDPCLNCYFDPETGKYYELA
uniref:Chromosome 3 open reading frame 67 n=1 Tax=Chelydra serpentina TaxID=8475 RepID=A0A8C3RRW1_CHESE